MDDELTADEIDVNFKAMDDSVNLINDTIADDSKAIESFNGSTAEVKLMMTRNTDHLELQLDKYWAKDDSRDKSSYTDAIAAGKEYVG
tara:strand:+ start:2226 stop:2489 length:264 start_codon:yes stop_codon:yes gene_type:complete